MTAGIAIFLKTPGLSPDKTRLAAGIGEGAEVDFHLAPAKATWSGVCTGSNVDRAEELPGLSRALASLAHAVAEQERQLTFMDKVLLDRKEDAWFQDFRRAAG